MSVLTMPPSGPAPPPEPIARLTIDQYHAMIKAGILTDGDPIELLEGWLVEKMPKNRPHIRSTRKVRIALEKIVLPGWYVESQDPVTTSDSEPEPDVSVVRGDADDYRDEHPGPTDVGLIVEVSDSTLARNRGIKKRLFARANIPIYWIVNLNDRCIEVYTDPTGPAEKPDYLHQHIYGETDFVPVILDGKEIGQLEVKAILP